MKRKLYNDFLEYVETKSTRVKSKKVFVKMIKAKKDSREQIVDIDYETSDDILYYKTVKFKKVRIMMREKRKALNDFYIGKRQYVGSFYHSQNFFFCYNLN
jgi:hypothetical protein